MLGAILDRFAICKQGVFFQRPVSVPVKLPVLVGVVATRATEDVLHSVNAREHALIMIDLINISVTKWYCR